MKKVLFMLVLVFGVIASIQAQDFVNCLVLDKTGSMVGIGDGHGQNIWDDVKQYCYDMVDNVSVPTKIVVFTFDEKTYGPQLFDVRNSRDKEDVKNHLKSVQADGLSTAVYTAVKNAFDYLQENFKDSKKLIYLVTDGNDNASSLSFDDICEKFEMERSEYDYLYYIDLRSILTEEMALKIENTKGMRYGKGFTKTITINPIFSFVNYTLEKSQFIEQRFVFSSGELTDDFRFNTTITEAGGINIDINPSMGISFDQLSKIEEGKYSIKYTLDLLMRLKMNVRLELT